MKFLRYLLPSETPQNVLNQGSLVILRERTFHTILLFASVMALIGFSFVLPKAIQRDNYSSLVIMSGLLGLFLVLTLGRPLPYTLRAVALLLAIFAVSIYTFSFSGLAGNGKIIMVALPILAAILLGTAAGITSLIVTTITFIGFSFAMSQGIIKAPDPIQYGDSSVANLWTSAIVYFFLFTTMATISLIAFINNLQKTINQQKGLSQEIENERKNLEENINQRTQDLAVRLGQIRSAAEISRSISSVLNLDDLLTQVAEQIQNRFNLYYVGVFLIDDTGKYAVLRAGTGSAGKEMLSRRHQLPVAGASMIGWSTANQKPRIALDVGEDAVRFNNPLLPGTRSEMALPILSRGVSLGALTVQSEKQNAFDNDDILVLQGVADSLAVAIENANLFTTSQHNLEEIRRLNRQYLQQSWEDTLSTGNGLDYTYVASARHSSTDDQRTINVPLSVRDQVIGEITLDVDGGNLSDQDQAAIETISSQTAQALENARLLEEVGRRAAQEEKLNNLTNEFSQASSVDEIIRSAILNLGQIPNVTEVSLHISPPLDAIPDSSTPVNQRKNGNGHHSQDGSK